MKVVVEGDGAIAIDRINSNAEGSTEIWRGKWSTGWAFVKPLYQLDKFEFETLLVNNGDLSRT